MTDLAKLATDVAAYAGTMTSANARFESLTDQYWNTDGDVAALQQIVDGLREVLSAVQPLDGADVTLTATLDEARTLLDAIETALADVDAIGAGLIAEQIDEVAAAIEAAITPPPPLETLAARLQRRRREARAAEDELLDEEAAAVEADAAADDGANAAADGEPVDEAAEAADDPAAEDDPGVFDPMAFETVEQVDAEIALYEAEIAAIHADLAGYEEIIRQLGERRDQIESGADEAVDEANAEAMAAA